MGDELEEPVLMQLDSELGKDVLPQESHDVQTEGKAQDSFLHGSQVQERQHGPASQQDFHLLRCQRGL